MKVISTESNLASATNVGNATVVRVYNSSPYTETITKKDAAGNTLGTMTVSAGEVVYCEKQYTDTLEGGATLKASQIAYSNMMYYASAASGGGGSSGLITDGLVLHLDPDDSSSYSGSGTAWNNLVSSGGASNGTLVNGVTYTPAYGSDGGFFGFDGSNDYVDFNTFNFGTAITLFCFARPEDRYSIRTLFSNAGAGGDDDGVHFYLNNWATTNNKMVTEIGNGSTGSALSTTNAVTNNSWQSLTYTYDKANNKLITYNNTTEWGVSTSATIDSQLTAAFKIGRFEEISNYYYKGRIGIYLLYNRELTSSEVSQLYNHYKSRYGL